MTAAHGVACVFWAFWRMDNKNPSNFYQFGGSLKKDMFYIFVCCHRSALCLMFAILFNNLSVTYAFLAFVCRTCDGNVFQWLCRDDSKIAVPHVRCHCCWIAWRRSSTRAMWTTAQLPRSKKAWGSTRAVASSSTCLSGWKRLHHPKTFNPWSRVWWSSSCTPTLMRIWPTSSRTTFLQLTCLQ